MKKLSIVVSVYNEEAVIGLFYSAFLEIKELLKWEAELIFVNDGSLDKSMDILEKIAEDSKEVKVVSFSRNFGHEAAMIAGIDNATGDGIVCMDVDLQHPLACLPEIIEKFEDGYDVINMVRIENKSAGWVKNITSKVFYRVINLLSDQAKFEPNASDFFAINRRAADVLRNSYREKERFLRGYVQSIGYNRTTIEYTAAERAAGKSHYSMQKLMRFSINTIVSYSNFPLKLGMYAGGIVAVLGLIVLVYSLFTAEGAPSGYSTIVVLICFMFAVLFALIGIIGQYIAIIFTELKDRPLYIIDKSINF